MPDGLTNVPVSYLWSFGDGNTSTDITPTHTYGDPGTYFVTLTVTTPNGCSSDATGAGQVIVHATPTASFTASPWSTTFDSPTIDLTAQTGAGIVSYAWDLGDGDQENGAQVSHTYGDVGAFVVTLEVTDLNGCTAEASHVVQILPVYDITIPNAFTPADGGGNGGGYDPNALNNDVFYPFVRFVKEFRMLIYDRWGELVFESNDVHIGWDGYYRGRLCQQDAYVYHIQVRFVDDHVIERRGDVTLFR
jgi:gliding motility-associated-like protein